MFYHLVLTYILLYPILLHQIFRQNAVNKKRKRINIYNATKKSTDFFDGIVYLSRSAGKKNLNNYMSAKGRLNNN